MILKIVVPVHIPEFVPIQKKWLMNLRNGYNDIDIEAHFDKGEPPSGRNVRQRFTDFYANKDLYVHFLDNDNLIPDYVIDNLAFLDDNVWYGEPKIIVHSQIWWANGPKRLEAKPENCVPCKCDIAQLFVHGSFLKDMVWTSRYENDGDFIAELYRRYPNDFVFINDVDVWYNALKPNFGLYNNSISQIA